MDDGVSLILFETPGLALFAQYQTFVVKHFDLHADIVEGLETEVVLDDGSIRWQTFDRVALDQQTVALVLEIAVDLSFGQISKRDIPEQCHGTRETQIVRVRAFLSPLPQQITSLAPLLA